MDTNVGTVQIHNTNSTALKKNCVSDMRPDVFVRGIGLYPSHIGVVVLTYKL